MYLVINENKNSTLLPYTERYVLFRDLPKAKEYAKSIGFTDCFGLGLNIQPGVARTYRCGDVSVTMVHVEAVD